MVSNHLITFVTNVYAAALISTVDVISLHLIFYDDNEVPLSVSLFPVLISNTQCITNT